MLDKILATSEADVAKLPIEGKANRTPTDEEIKFYSIFVIQDIRKIKPRKILLAGASAMSAFGINMPVGAARLQTFNFEGIPTFCTYHPCMS
jgi:uracil-DNA glycosylase family 4